MIKTEIHNAFMKANPMVIIGFVIWTFCFDFLDKIEIFYDIDFPKFNRHLKIAIVVYSIGFMLISAPYVWKHLRYLIITLFALSAIFVLKYDYWDLYHQEFFRYCFILVFYPVIHYSFFKAKDQNLSNMFYKVLKILVIINLAAIFIGMVFNLQIFDTYQFHRPGYNGILLSQGLTPYVYLAASVMFWTYKDNWMLVVLFLAATLSGVKGVYFGIFVLFIPLIWFDKKYSNTFKIRMASLFSVAFIAVLAVIFMTPTFMKVIKEDGFMSAIFSYRLDYLHEMMETNPAESFNVFIGAVGLETIRLELQIVDILLFFGAIGLVVYIYFMVLVYKDVVKCFSAKAFFIASLVLSLLSGNLFYIPLVATLFFLTLFSLNQRSRGNKGVDI